MEETHTTQALILRNRPYKERDSQIELYSPEFGRISLVARGTKDKKSKFAGYIEPLTLVNLGLRLPLGLTLVYRYMTLVVILFFSVVVHGCGQQMVVRHILITYQYLPIQVIIVLVFTA